MDNVIKEINKFFQNLNLNKIVINGIENFEYNGEYYLLTKSGTNYYLECALSLEDAKNNIYEDMEAYSSKLYSFDELIVNIKNDITQFLLN
ncbi:hypothetical protein [Gottfriedia luciferensis]|uniref:hypothetical protein n=1 Tax=Gottfriedia luciferensis TaxID=178774 RepID=UPI000B44D4B2|nr:hypothetical protein [Gottfriedia luciferensis]